MSEESVFFWPFDLTVVVSGRVLVRFHPEVIKKGHNIILMVND